ncbi:hypothetical protein KR215_004630 [Drosophila sulfurigaster]|nr:hypothetical protein KR215_004630 [Drosophila sulfurigaster]
MGTGYKLNPSEINCHNKMCYTKVAPILVLPTLPPPPPIRPVMTSPAVKGIRRNLFGSCGDGEIDKILSTQQEKDANYLKQRYNIDLKKLAENCSPQISTFSKNKTDGGKPNLTATSPYARIPGVKGNFRVRKAHNANSNVPKCIANNLSSEMGTNGQQLMQQLQKEDDNERQ